MKCGVTKMDLTSAWFTFCGRSCISYGLIQIVRDVISCSFFSIFVSSFNCACDVEISVVPDFDP